MHQHSKLNILYSMHTDLYYCILCNSNSVLYIYIQYYYSVLQYIIFSNFIYITYYSLLYKVHYACCIRCNIELSSDIHTCIIYIYIYMYSTNIVPNNIIFGHIIFIEPM